MNLKNKGLSKEVKMKNILEMALGIKDLTLFFMT